MPVIEGYNFTVDLQDRGMVKTLRLIKSEARALKAVMRSDFAEMKNNEGNLAAYTARLKDAESVVNKYSEAIRRLKKENEKFQSAERNGTLSDAQKSNWARNINTIERYKFQIANLSAQMNKDRFTIERLKIGVDTLRKSTEAVTTSTKAYSSALREQGKFYQAERANATGLKAQRAALQAQMRSEISATTVLRNKQAGLVNEYNIQKGKLASYTASLARANAELTKNTAEYGKNNVKTQMSKASVDVYRKSIEETRGKIAGLSERIGKNSTTLANQAGEAKKTASSLREVSRASRSIGNTRLGSIYKAGSAHLARFNSALKESTAHTRKWWQESRNAFTGVGVALGGIAFEAGRAIKSASDIQKKYVEVGNLLKTSGESAAEATNHVSEMQKKGIVWSEKYGFSQKEIGTQFEELVRKGYSGTAALGSMKAMMEASRASGDDLADVVKVTSQAVDAFGLRTSNTTKMMENSTRVANAMASGADRTAAGFQDMGVAMAYVSGTAKTVGWNVEQTSAAIGEMSNRGLAGTRAGTSLRQVINSLIKPTKGAKKALQEANLSVDDFHTKSGKMKDVDKIFETINSHLKGMTNTQKGAFFKALFGATGQQAGQFLAETARKIRVNKKVIDGLMRSIKNPSRSVRNELKKASLSVDDFRTKSGKLKKTADIFEMLQKHTKDMSKGEKAAFFKKLFGADGAKSAEYLTANAKALKNNRSELSQLIADIKHDEKTDYIGRLARANMKSASMRMETLKQTALALEATVGSALLPAVNAVGRGIAKWALSKEGKKSFKDANRWASRLAKTVTDNIPNIIAFGKGFSDGVKDVYKVIKPVVSAVKGIGSYLDRINGHSHVLAHSAGTVAGVVAAALITIKGIKTVGGGVVALTKDAYTFGSKIYGVLTGQNTKQTSLNDELKITNEILQQNVRLQQEFYKYQQASAETTATPTTDLAGDIGTVGKEERTASKATSMASKEAEVAADTASSTFSQRFIGKIKGTNGLKWKEVFRGAEPAAETAGKAGSTGIITKLGTLVRGSKAGELMGIGSKVLGLVGIGMQTFDLASSFAGAMKGKKSDWQNVGSDLGGMIGSGVAFFFGQPELMPITGAIGSWIGNQIPRAIEKAKPAIKGMGHGIQEFMQLGFGEGRWDKAGNSAIKGLSDVVKNAKNYLLNRKVNLIDVLFPPLAIAKGVAQGFQIGKKDVDSFIKGWQSGKKPRKFWSLENLGFSAHNMIKGLGSWGQKASGNFIKGWLENKKPKKFWSIENLGFSISTILGGKTKIGKKIAQKIISGYRSNKKPKKFWSLENLGFSIGYITRNKNKIGQKIAEQIEKGYKSKKKPKKFWSLETLGYESKTMFKGFKKGMKDFLKYVNSQTKKLKKKGFKKWADDLVKDTHKGWKKFVEKQHDRSLAFYRSVGKNFKSFKKDFSKNWKNWLNGLLHNRYVTAFKKHRFFQTALGDIKSRFKGWKVDFSKLWNGHWSGTTKSKGTKDFKRHSWFNGGLNSISSAWSKFSSDFGKNWSNFWSGITNDLKGTWNNIVGGANDVIRMFGGKKTTFHNYLKFANGTGPLTQPTVGILNDGYDAPEIQNREGILHPDGNLEIPSGRFITRLLNPGTQIIKSSDLSRLLGARHFASGTLNSIDLRGLVHLERNGFNLEELGKKILKVNSDLLLVSKKNRRDAKKRNAKKKRLKVPQVSEFNPLAYYGSMKTAVKQLASHKSGEKIWLTNTVLGRLGMKSGGRAGGKFVTASSKILHSINNLYKRSKKQADEQAKEHKRKVNARKRREAQKQRLLKLKLDREVQEKNARIRRRHSRTGRSRRTSSRSYGLGRLTSIRTYTRRRRSYSSRGSGGQVSVSVSRGSVSAVKALASAIKRLKNKKVKISVNYSGTWKAKQSINRLIKSIENLNRKRKPRISVKYSGTYKAKQSVNRLIKALGRLKKKAKTKIKVKYSGTYKAKKSVDRLTKAIKSLKNNTKSLTKAAKKTKFGTYLSKQAKSAVKSLKGKGNFVKVFKDMVKDFKKELNSMSKESKKQFSSMWKAIVKETKTSERNIDSETKRFGRNFERGFKSLENGVRSTFRHFWSVMKSSAKHGLNGVIDELNRAISSINGVVREFGGSKHAVSRAKRLATGTGFFSGQRKAITKPTLAVLNDGNDSPKTRNEETVWTPSTNTFEVVHGRNILALLKPGQEVFNATESKQLGFTHFASGTGGLKKLYELAKKYWKKPVQTGKAMFPGVHGLTGALLEIAQGIHKRGEDSGVEWWSQLWKMVEDKVDDDNGPASGLLKAVEKIGEGMRYSQSARMSKFAADCSSLVSRALKKYYHQDWAVPNGWALTVAGLWRHAHKISRSQAKPGDPIFWLPDYHVGIYAGHGRYYSAFSKTASPQVGMHSIAESVPGVSPTYARFDGLNTEGNKSDNPVVKAKTALQKKIKAQVGKGFWKTVQRIANKFGDSGMASAFRASGDVRHRARAIAKAISQAVPGATRNGLAAIIGSWLFESGGLNPKAINPSSGASGFGQWLGSRLSSLKAYARRHGKSWTDPATQINFAASQEGIDSSRFRRVARGHGSATELAYEFSRIWERGGYDAQHASAARQVAGLLRGFANGGIARKASIFGEAGPEMAIPLSTDKLNRSRELVAQTLAALSENGGNGGQRAQTAQNNQFQAELLDAVKSLAQMVEQLQNKQELVETYINVDGQMLAQKLDKYIRKNQMAHYTNGRMNRSNAF